MTQYAVHIAPRAIKDLATFQRKDQIKIREKIDALSLNPRPNGVKKLTDGTYRIRQGIYRIIYDIHDKKVEVLVLKICNRSIAYR